MLTTMDTAGRIVVPKSLRVALGLRGGETLNIVARDGRIEIEPAPTPMRLEGSGQDVFAVSDETLPPLTDDDVRAVIEQSRR